jgi:hypothetical protein
MRSTKHSSTKASGSAFKFSPAVGIAGGTSDKADIAREDRAAMRHFSGSKACRCERRDTVHVLACAARLTPDACRTAGAYAHRMNDTTRNVHIFVLQVWIEPQAGGPGSRRGYVEHVVTRERRYFSAIDEALAFVEAFARPREPD